MKFVMTQAVCPEGMQLLDGIADVYVADNQDPNNYLDEMIVLIQFFSAKPILSE